MLNSDAKGITMSPMAATDVNIQALAFNLSLPSELHVFSVQA